MIPAMTSKTIGLPDDVQDYILQWGLREPPILAKLREETAAHPRSMMQIAPEQGAFIGLVAEMLGARRCLEIGTFTGYSSVALALTLPDDGKLICCDVSDEYTAVARRYWEEAGVADHVELRLGPAVETLDAMLEAGEAGTFDLAFIDADKPGYVDYYERCIELLRHGGVVLLDNVLRSGAVARPEVDDEDVRGIRAVNERIAGDHRVTHVLLAIADGMTLARKR
jgi:predicted O-methyltransferase YrrM